MVESTQRSRSVLNRALAPLGTTIFTEMSQLAQERGAVNLGQGFPDFPGPSFIKEAARRAIDADHNQYAPMAGLPGLRAAIAAKLAQRHGLRYDPNSEVTIFSGCTEAIHCALLALCEPGDEVVLLEPYYDSYVASVAMAGAVPRYVTLRAPHFAWDPNELEAAFNARTRLVLLNTPHNPTGRVLSRAELGQVARLCRRYDTYVVSDEVYEHLAVALLAFDRDRGNLGARCPGSSDDAKLFEKRLQAHQQLFAKKRGALIKKLNAAKQAAGGAGGRIWEQHQEAARAANPMPCLKYRCDDW